MGNFTPELPPPTTLPTTTKKYKKPYFPAEIDIETGGAKIDIGMKCLQNNSNYFHFLHSDWLIGNLYTSIKFTV